MKKKVNSTIASKRTAKETPHKARRKRISRWISSGPSASFEQTGREVQRQKVPMFYQPRSPLPNSQSTSHNLDCPAAREPTPAFFIRSSRLRTPDTGVGYHSSTLPHRFKTPAGWHNRMGSPLRDLFEYHCDWCTRLPLRLRYTR